MKASGERRAASGERRIVLAALAALLLVGTLVWATGREANGLATADPHADAEYYYVYWPALLRGDLDFTTEYRETRNWYSFGATPTGRPSNVFGIGPVVVNAPFLALGHLIAKAKGDRADGFSAPELRLFTYPSLLWSLGALFVAYRLVRRRIGGGALAIAGPVIAALAGPVAYYAVRLPGYTHPMATFFSTFLVERWDASYDGPSPRSARVWCVLGLLAGAAALVRPQLGLWSLLLLHAALDDWKKARGTGAPSAVSTVRWLAAGILALVAFSPQLVAWKVLYGRWYLVPQGEHFMRWDDPCWTEALFSSRNGLFPYSPAYAIFVLALIVGARRLPRLAGGLLAGFLLQAVANGAAWDWWAGGSFGGRRFDSAYPVVAVGAALLVAWTAAALEPTLAGEASRVKAASGLVAMVATLFAVELVAVNLALVGSYTVTSARIAGGEAASLVFRARVPPVLSAPAAWLSGVSNFPLRAMFALRYGASLKDYDRVVGVHLLGETYPGLNGPEDEKTARIDVHETANPIFAGLSFAPGDAASMPGGRARVLVVLNRYDRIQLTMTLDGHGPATLRWNGRRVLGQQLAGPTVLRFSVERARRETNELTIESPPGTLLHPIEVQALP